MSIPVGTQIAPCTNPPAGEEVKYALFYVDHYVAPIPASPRTVQYVALVLAAEVKRLQQSEEELTDILINEHTRTPSPNDHLI